jgi:hypothetical protein
MKKKKQKKKERDDDDAAAEPKVIPAKDEHTEHKKKKKAKEDATPATPKTKTGGLSETAVVSLMQICLQDVDAETGLSAEQRETLIWAGKGLQMLAKKQ